MFHLDLDRYLGALWGGVLGDALGRPYEGTRPRVPLPFAAEFQPWPGWRSAPKGTITDDTHPTMCVA